MPDSAALAVIAVIAAGLIALALVFPQGQGARSPGPFGHPLAPVAAPAAPVKGPALRGPAPVAAPVRSPKPAPPASPF